MFTLLEFGWGFTEREEDLSLMRALCAHKGFLFTWEARVSEARVILSSFFPLSLSFPVSFSQVFVVCFSRNLSLCLTISCQQSCRRCLSDSIKVKYTAAVLKLLTFC